jgi:hypothetical protein
MVLRRITNWLFGGPFKVGDSIDAFFVELEQGCYRYFCCPVHRKKLIIGREIAMEDLQREINEDGHIYYGRQFFQEQQVFFPMPKENFDLFALRPDYFIERASVLVDTAMSYATVLWDHALNGASDASFASSIQPEKWKTFFPVAAIWMANYALACWPIPMDLQQRVAGIISARLAECPPKWHEACDDIDRYLTEFAKKPILPLPREEWEERTVDLFKPIGRWLGSKLFLPPGNVKDEDAASMLWGTVICQIYGNWWDPLEEERQRKRYGKQGNA